MSSPPWHSGELQDSTGSASLHSGGLQGRTGSTLLHSGKLQFSCSEYTRGDTCGGSFVVADLGRIVRRICFTSVPSENTMVNKIMTCPFLGHCGMESVSDSLSARSNLLKRMLVFECNTCHRSCINVSCWSTFSEFHGYQGILRHFEDSHNLSHSIYVTTSSSFLGTFIGHFNVFSRNLYWPQHTFPVCWTSV